MDTILSESRVGGTDPNRASFPGPSQLAQSADSVISSVEEALNVYDFEKAARQAMLPEHWAYLETGVNDDGADHHVSEAVLNDMAFDWLQLRPQRLPQIRAVDTSVEIFGRRWERPFALCPVGSLNGFHTQGELGTARAARSRNMLQMLSTVSSTSVEDVNEARGEPVWYQLYAPQNWQTALQLLDRVEGSGCDVLVWTIDLIGGSNRETVDRAVGPDGTDQELCQQCHSHQPDYQKPMARGLDGPLFGGDGDPFTWAYVRGLKDATDMQIVVKGIMTREGARAAIDHGADAIMISNHGGRAVAHGLSTIEVLPEIVAEVDGEVPVILDSGIRRGTDIYKALALGADLVGIGRPYVWGLGAFGQEGVESVIDLLTAEFEMVMRQMGATSVDEIRRGSVMDPTGRILRG
ncbi:MAG: alpha-hydroxy acid oxidase [Longimicrobiales bacterium]|nr:alpha-hydroxy acid oxidase [Longimicrobiales bacterium]